MNPDNRNFPRDNCPCAPGANPLSARPLGDVLQGAAADCNSGHGIADFPHLFRLLDQDFGFDNSPGQTGNATKTSTTEVMDWPAMSDDASPISGWWLPPAVVIGLAALAALVWWGW